MAMLMKTYSGKLINLEAPQAESICMSDISWGLSCERRFGNQSPVFISVAQHSVLVGAIAARLFETRLAMPDAYILGWKAGLLHDAHEAYIGDMTRPFKHAVCSISPQAFQTLKRIAQQLDNVIFKALGMNADIMAHELIHQADNMALCLEAEHWCRWDITGWEEKQDCSGLGLESYMRFPPLSAATAFNDYWLCWIDAVAGDTNSLKRRMEEADNAA